MSLYYTDDAVTLHHGHALDVLRTLPDRSVNCVVTSPPYFGLRDYGTPDQIGLEASPSAYVETMRALFAEVRRVLADDGTLWLNLGDSYASGEVERHDYADGSKIKRGSQNGRRYSSLKTGLRHKNLLGIPWRVAFALQDDGWILRNDIIWAKPNGMPESVTDRLSTKHEHVFMFSKKPRYWFNLDPIREATVYPPGAPALSFDRDSKECDVPGQSMRQHRAGKRPKLEGRNPQALEFGGKHDGSHPRGKNPGDVWSIPTSPFPGAHFAVMAPELARRCVLAGCPEGGTVLDPFSGVGTTGMVATANGRRYIGIDNNVETLALSLETRLAQGALIEEAL